MSSYANKSSLQPICPASPLYLSSIKPKSPKTHFISISHQPNVLYARIEHILEK
uniref:Uncharacterized protein n=1 Tax=Helianthus annuus TaxID=4232 RepID=A0A251VME6_HELAN